jgi:hypothetical protein
VHACLIEVLGVGDEWWRSWKWPYPWLYPCYLWPLSPFVSIPSQAFGDGNESKQREGIAVQELYQLFTPVDQDTPYTHLRARSYLCTVKSIGEAV